MIVEIPINDCQITFNMKNDIYEANEDDDEESEDFERLTIGDTSSNNDMLNAIHDLSDGSTSLHRVEET